MCSIPWRLARANHTMLAFHQIKYYFATSPCLAALRQWSSVVFYPSTPSASSALQGMSVYSRLKNVSPCFLSRRITYELCISPGLFHLQFPKGGLETVSTWNNSFKCSVSILTRPRFRGLVITTAHIRASPRMKMTRNWFPAWQIPPQIL